MGIERPLQELDFRGPKDVVGEAAHISCLNTSVNTSVVSSPQLPYVDFAAFFGSVFLSWRCGETLDMAHERP